MFFSRSRRRHDASGDARGVLVAKSSRAFPSRVFPRVRRVDAIESFETIERTLPASVRIRAGTVPAEHVGKRASREGGAGEAERRRGARARDERARHRGVRKSRRRRRGRARVRIRIDADESTLGDVVFGHAVGSRGRGGREFRRVSRADARFASEESRGGVVCESFARRRAEVAALG